MGLFGELAGLFDVLSGRAYMQRQHEYAQSFARLTQESEMKQTGYRTDNAIDAPCMTDFDSGIDVHGWLRPGHIIGNILSHTGPRKQQYVIFGFVWLGETDEWGYVHREAGKDGPAIVRPLSHLCGLRSDGSFRYEEHNDYLMFML